MIFNAIRACFIVSNPEKTKRIFDFFARMWYIGNRKTHKKRPRKAAANNKKHLNIKGMNRTLQRTIFILAVLVLVLDIFGLYVPAKFGTCWLVIPDALENAFCADNFLREGKYGLYLNGVLHPSRYLPWFPLLL